MYFYAKQRDITFAGDGEVVAMRYRAAALFPLFLHGKEHGMWEQKREETWFKNLLQDFW